MGSDDPWEWSVDEVVQAFCKSSNLWAERKHSALPDPVKFEQALRHNQVNGSTLLTHVTTEVLKNDFGVTSLGILSAVTWAIQQLQWKSSRYLQHERQHAEIKQFISHGSAPALTATALKLPPTSTEPTTTSPLSPVGEHVRPGEVLTEDASGRKRRKLNLAPVTVEEGTVALQLSRRLQKNSRRAFLGPQKTTVEDVFFGKTKLGAKMPQDDDFQSISRGAAEDEELFQFHCGGGGESTNQPQFAYEQRFIGNQMRHFLHKAEQTIISHHGRQAVALYPYRAQGGTTSESRSVILFREASGQLTATRERLDLLGTPYYDELNQKDNKNHDWDFLYHWRDQQNQEKVLPVFGDSSSEMDVSTSFANELEEEKRELEASIARKNEQPTKAQVSRIIDETTEAYATEWREKKEPLREHDAWKIWRRASRKFPRSSCISAAETTIQHYKKRLEDCKRWMLDNNYKDEEEIRHSCENLKATVYQREEENFNVSVWKRHQAPLRPQVGFRVVKKKKKPRPETTADEEDIDLSSGSEIDEGVVDAFIEHDELSPDVDQSPPGECGIVTEHLNDSAPPAESPDRMDVDRLEAERPNKDTIIDLGAPSEDKSDSDDHPLPLAQSINSPLRKLIQTADDEILGWDWEKLEEDQDRRRVILKLLRTIPPNKYNALKERVLTLDASQIQDETYGALQAITEGSKIVPRHGGAAIEQVADIIFDITRLVVCWHECSHYYWKDVDPQAAQSMLDDDNTQSSIAEFLKLATYIFRAHPQAIGGLSAPQLAVDDRMEEEDEEDDLSSVSSGDLGEDSNHKSLLMDRDAIKKREKARQRQAASQLHTQALISQSQSQELFGEGELKVLVNIDEQKEDFQVYIHSAIAPKMQQHQIDGVRFMWREVVEGEAGCLLAHTMGLGKTMQSIAFLHTLLEASQDPQIKETLPKYLRGPKIRTLILCPPSLINNWLEEFRKWLPPKLMETVGPVHYLDSTTTNRDSRLQTIKTWVREGSVLILGYELFRSLVAEPSDRLKAANGSGTRKNSKSGTDSAIEHDEQPSEDPLQIKMRKAFQEALFECSSLVIADEAHKLKNINSLIATTASKFQSPSRIALTGSPMSNNLKEYFAMIEWIDKGYLGAAHEFNARFRKPIEDGLWKDSHPQERRKALKQLRVLLMELGPKVSRRNITALKGSLKPKMEFVLTTSLTPLQKELYSAVVQEALGEPLSKKGEMSTTSAWKWLGILMLVCNHPNALLFKMKHEGKSMKKFCKVKTKASGLSAKSDDPSELINESTIDVPLSLKQRLQKIFACVRNKPESEEWSSKAAILMSILENAKAAGDRVLLFSHSIPTLDHYETFLQSRDFRTKRLDGEIPTVVRLDLANEFNAGAFDVFLISTTAGGTGFNLTGANRVVLLDFLNNPQQEEQAVGRSYRLGQEKPVFVYRFVTAGTYEAPLYEQAKFKTQLAYRAVERKKYRSQAVKMNQMIFPLTPDHELEDLDEHIGKDPNVLDKLLEHKSRQERGGDYPIRKIVTAEVLQVEAPEDEELTAEEEKEVDELFEIERLRKENPAEFELRYGPPTTRPMSAQAQLGQQQLGQQQPGQQQPGQQRHGQQQQSAPSSREMELKVLALGKACAGFTRLELMTALEQSNGDVSAASNKLHSLLRPSKQSAQPAQPAVSSATSGSLPSATATPPAASGTITPGNAPPGPGTPASGLKSPIKLSRDLRDPGSESQRKLKQNFDDEVTRSAKDRPTTVPPQTRTSSAEPRIHSAPTQARRRETTPKNISSSMPSAGITRSTSPEPVGTTEGTLDAKPGASRNMVNDTPGREVIVIDDDTDDSDGDAIKRPQIKRSHRPTSFQGRSDGAFDLPPRQPPSPWIKPEKRMKYSTKRGSSNRPPKSPEQLTFSQPPPRTFGSQTFVGPRKLPDDIERDFGGSQS